MEWSSEVVMEFIDLFEGEPSIWNPKHEHHKNKNTVYDAWNRIRDNLSVECSLKEIKKKKDSLMAIYRKVANKVKNSVSTGSGTDTVYKPEWFAYERMATFLNAVYSPRHTTSSEMQGTAPPRNEETEEDETLAEEVNPSTATAGNSNNSNDNDVTNRRESMTGGPPVGKKRKNHSLVQVKKRMDEAYLYLKQAASKQNKCKDRTELFCDLLCSKLKCLDETTRDLAMHEIDNLMFNFKHRNRSYMMSNISKQSPYDVYSSPASWSTDGSRQSDVLPATTAELLTAPVDSPSTLCENSQHFTTLENIPRAKTMAELFSNFNIQ